jgi:integral membrane protein (TIGR01906 family)
VTAGAAEAGKALIRGVQASLLGMVGLIVLLSLAFGILFVGFHRLFFEGQTWIFPYSDTFIRLYPERFWRDSFAYLAFLGAAQAGAIWLLARRWTQGNERG